MKSKEVGARLWEIARGVVKFLRISVQEWIADKALRHAAALAFYSVFSLAPLLVISIAVAGFFFGEAAVEGEIVGQLQDFVGSEQARFIEDMLRQARETGTGLLPTLISVGTTLFGALVVFSALQDALNQIWGVEPAEDMGILYTIRRRFFAFTMVVLLGVLIFASLLVRTVLSAVKSYAGVLLDWGLASTLWAYSDQAVFLISFTALFGVIYKLLPDVQMAWRDVWLGALLTSVLFQVGRYFVSVYLAISSVGSIFGAAGTLAVLLTWIYYSWMIVLMGAEMTQVFARSYGRGVSPGENAIFRADRKILDG